MNIFEYIVQIQSTLHNFQFSTITHYTARDERFTKEIHYTLKLDSYSKWMSLRRETTRTKRSQITRLVFNFFFHLSFSVLGLSAHLSLLLYYLWSTNICSSVTIYSILFSIPCFPIYIKFRVQIYIY